MSLVFKDYSVILHGGHAVTFRGEIAEGERLFLSGPSGLGKTTFIKSLLGLHSHHQGSLILKKAEITNLSPQKRKIGTCFQGAILWDHLSVYENIRWALSLTQTLGQRDILAELESVGLENSQKKFPAQLSGGERSRVAILRTILCDRDFYIFDEAFSGIDEKNKQNVYKKIIKELESRNTGALFVSHNESEIENLATRVKNWEGGSRCLEL
jgi:ABC-type Fe3+/spermidine/putrescine transport system ATPase subunit